MILGGNSFPFNYSTFYVNCNESTVAESFAKEVKLKLIQNIYVKKGLATSQLMEVDRISESKFGNLFNFYEMKLEV